MTFIKKVFNNHFKVLCIDENNRTILNQIMKVNERDRGNVKTVWDG